MPQSRSAQLAGDKALLAGLEKHFAKRSLPLAGGTHGSKELVAMLKARIAAAETVLPVKAQLRALLAAEDAETTKTQPVVVALVEYLHATLGPDTAKLSEFGLAPRKRRGSGKKTKRANHATSSTPTSPSASSGAPAATTPHA